MLSGDGLSASMTEPLHGGLRFVYPVQACPGQPIEIVAAYHDGHCERLPVSDQWAIQMIADLAGMVRGNMARSLGEDPPTNPNVASS